MRHSLLRVLPVGAKYKHVSHVVALSQNPIVRARYEMHAFVGCISTTDEASAKKHDR
jgi:hypothetical protein